jgi:hypothetical protein
MMTHILQDLLHKAVIGYIHSIVIYLKNEEIQDKLVREVLERLAKNDLVISIEKRVLEVQQVEFLAYI